MNNNFWGPPFWMMIHTSAGNATKPEKVNSFLKFANEHLEHLLGCDLCAEHYVENKKEIDIFKHLEYWTSEDRKYEKMSINEALLFWTYLIHEKVNYKLKKPTFDWKACKILYLPKKDHCDMVCGETHEDECQYVTKLMKICNGISTEVTNSEVVTGKKDTVKNLDEEKVNNQDRVNEDKITRKKNTLTKKDITIKKDIKPCDDNKDLMLKNRVPEFLLGKSSRIGGLYSNIKL
jgi:hypothetical protein